MNKKRKPNIKKLFYVIILILLIIILLIKYKNTQIQENLTINQESFNEEKKDDTTVETSASSQSELEKRLSSGKTLGEEGLPILMYHFFYDKANGKGKDGNHIEISKFENQIKYLSENDFFFPTWDEVEKYIDGEQELPEKSVVITVDDGDPSFFELAVPIIQKYKVPVTSFLITYWYGNRANDKQEYVNYQSHSYDMHRSGADGKGVILSWDYDKIKEDVLLSSQVLGGANIFCYPFGHYNDLSKKVLQENGYKLALTTAAGRVKKGTPKYELPRVRIDGNTSLLSFINKVK